MLRRFPLLLLAAAVAAGARSADAPSTVPAPVSQVALRAAAACARAMAEQRCGAQAGPAAAEPADSELPAVVFVAGAGAMRGDVYRALRQADGGMCELVRAACLREPQGALCVAAQRLW